MADWAFRIDQTRFVVGGLKPMDVPGTLLAGPLCHTVLNVVHGTLMSFSLWGSAARGRTGCR